MGVIQNQNPFFPTVPLKFTRLRRGKTAAKNEADLSALRLKYKKRILAGQIRQTITNRV
jgi:hypothetical protein